MIKRSLLPLLMALVLAIPGCGTAAPAPSGTTQTQEESSAGSTSEETAAEAAEETAAIPASTQGGNPWIDSDLKANLSADMELSPREDFHLYVNHDWLMNSEIPEGRRTHSSFMEVLDETNQKAVALLNDDTLTSHEARLVQSLYRAFLDWDSRNALGVEPLMKTVRDIEGIENMDALKAFLCDPSRSYFVDAFLKVGNAASREDSNKYITGVYNDSFTLNDAAEYAKRTEMGDTLYEAALYKTKAMLSRIGYSEEEAAAMFDAMLDLESRIAEVSFTSADMMSTDFIRKSNNHFTPDELRALSPDYPLCDRLQGYGYGEAQDLLVVQPETVRRINELFKQENLSAIKAYMLVRYVNSCASLLDQEAYEVHIKAANMSTGAVGREPDETAAFSIVRSTLRGAMGKAYVDKYGDPELKQRITQICEDLIRVYREILAGETWMSEETRNKAIEKLDAIRINAAYPDKWIDYSSLNLEGLSYMECSRAVSMFNKERDRSHTNGTVDKEIWTMDFLQPNASYDRSHNSINIYLGILGAPFYYEGISDEELLGGIGSVIGHEISHAFDTGGALFNKDGNVQNWWTDEDYAAFQGRASKLAAFYDNITVWDGQTMIGQNVQTEAIADIAGMKAVLAVAGTRENFDYEKFFKAYATIWRRINTRELEYLSITQDPHPLHYARTNITLQQFDEFLDTFGIQEGDTMYLPENERILVW